MSPSTTGPGMKPPWVDDPGLLQAGRFRLGPELGRGGMGRVHLAWDPMLLRTCAVKLLLGEDPELHLRFLREARCQAKVEHPNVCRIFDLGMAGNRPFIAMELLDGRSLAELGPELDFRQAGRILADVAGAVDAAHRAGLIHRDLKPSNILVVAEADGFLKPYVVDFGLAQDLLARNQTLSWAVMGTPSFMSPEQARGEALGPATDIYSLGATLFALISGQPPYECTTLGGLITLQASASPKRLRQVNPAVPKDLETLIHKCLELEPQKRYGSAKALEEDLRRWLDGKPILARPVGPLGRLGRWMRRKPALASSLAAGLLAVTVLGAWNFRTQRVARIREQAAQRFGMEIRDAEHLLRIERMLPVHDIRPAENRLRARMERIRKEMDQSGGVTRGPGLYAIGRGYFALKEFGPAKDHLEAAWRAGFQAPEVALSLGMVGLRSWEERAMELALSGTPPSAIEEERGAQTATALQWISKSEGTSVENPDYGRALVAFAKGQHAEAESFFKKALRESTWLHEAWLGRYRNLFLWKMGAFLKEAQEFSTVFREFEPTLLAARTLAPSDEDATAEHAKLFIAQYQFDSARKRRVEQPLIQADHLLEEALKVRPSSRGLLLLSANLSVQRAFLQLSIGMDPAPMLRERVDRLWGDSVREAWNKESEWHDCLGWLHHLWWLIAESDWRFGRNPAQALKEVQRFREMNPSGDVHHAFPLTIEAQFRAGSGQDPSTAYATGEKVFEPQKNHLTAFDKTVLAELLFSKATWQFQEGVEPDSTLRRGIDLLQSASAIEPILVYTFYWLPRFHALAARVLLATRRDPGASVHSALAAASRGLAINPRNAQIQQAAADAHLADGQARAAAGRDPGPALEAARQALDAADAVNPRDFRSFLLRAEVEKEAAAFVRAGGGDPVTELERLEKACRKGLGIKGDERRFRALLAEAKACQKGLPSLAAGVAKAATQVP